VTDKTPTGWEYKAVACRKMCDCRRRPWAKQRAATRVRMEAVGAAAERDHEGEIVGD
jgi:hypothetical protein